MKELNALIANSAAEPNSKNKFDARAWLDLAKHAKGLEERAAQNITYAQLGDKSVTEPVVLVFTGDWHLGCVSCDYEAFITNHDYLRTLPSNRVKIAVLGDMKELGEHTELCHRQIGAYLADLALDKIFWVGECGPAVEKGYLEKGGGNPIAVFADAEGLADSITGEFHAGDIVLVKGSRAGRLEKVVSAISAYHDTGKDH